MHYVEKEPKQKRFDFVEKLKSDQLHQLNLEIKKSRLKKNLKKGIF